MSDRVYCFYCYNELNILDGHWTLYTPIEVARYCDGDCLYYSLKEWKDDQVVEGFPKEVYIRNEKEYNQYKDADHMSIEMWNLHLARNRAIELCKLAHFKIVAELEEELNQLKESNNGKI